MRVERVLDERAASIARPGKPVRAGIPASLRSA